MAPWEPTSSATATLSVCATRPVDWHRVLCVRTTGWLGAHRPCDRLFVRSYCGDSRTLALLFVGPASCCAATTTTSLGSVVTPLTQPSHGLAGSRRLDPLTQHRCPTCGSRSRFDWALFLFLKKTVVFFFFKCECKENVGRLFCETHNSI